MTIHEIKDISKSYAKTWAESYINSYVGQKLTAGWVTTTECLVEQIVLAFNDLKPSLSFAADSTAIKVSDLKQTQI